MIRDQRLAIADLLDGLTPEQWEVPSLSAGWRVRDVAAHLALTPEHPSPAAMLAGAIRVRGNFDRLNHELAVAHAAGPPAQLAADIRRNSDSRRHPIVTGYRNLMFDVMVHAQDIALPLGLEILMPADAAAVGADRVWRMGWPFWARRRLRGFRLAATDVDWTVGAGAELRGPIAALLLVVTGRPAGIARLEGDGVDALVHRK